MKSFEDVDFTEDECDQIRLTPPKHIKALAKEWGADPSSLFAMRMHLFKKGKQTSAKPTLSPIKTVPMPSIVGNVLVVRYNQTSILLDKTNVSEVGFDGKDIIIRTI